MTASKLEYADDVGLLDWTAAEASARVSALESGLRASASMEMSAPKAKGMHVHIRDMHVKFTCADIPGAAYAPVTADDDNDGDVTEE